MGKKITKVYFWLNNPASGSQTWGFHRSVHFLKKFGLSLKKDTNFLILSNINKQMKKSLLPTININVLLNKGNFETTKAGWK